MTEELWDATQNLRHSIHLIYFNVQTAVASQIVDWFVSNNDTDKWTNAQESTVKQQMDKSPRASSVLRSSSAARKNSNNPMRKRNVEDNNPDGEIHSHNVCRCDQDLWRSTWTRLCDFSALIAVATTFFKEQVHFNRKMCIIWSLLDKLFPKAKHVARKKFENAPPMLNWDFF